MQSYTKINISECESHSCNTICLEFTNVNKQQQQRQQNKDIGIQSVAYGSYLSPLLSGKYQISFLPLDAKSLTLHSRSVWLLSGKTQIIHIRHLGLRNRFLQMYTYMSWTAGSRPHKSQNLFFSELIFYKKV